MTDASPAISRGKRQRGSIQISGEWYLCDDGVVRPILRGEVLTGKATWEPVLFLIDIGADRTVLSPDVLAALDLETVAASDRLSGLGGAVAPRIAETTIRFVREKGGDVTFRGQFAAVTDPEALDMSVIGRDITRLFAVIVDQPGNVVCLLGQRHRYVIIED